MTKRVVLTSAVLAAAAGSAMAQFSIPSAVIPGGNDPRTGEPWKGPGPYPRTVTAGNFDVSIRPGTILGANDDNGDQALKVFPIRSGPFPYTWTSGWTNEGDIDFNIAPVEPNNPESYPPDAFIRLRDGRDPVSGANDGGGLRTYAWSINQFAGVVTASIRANGRDNLDTLFGLPVGRLYGIANVSADDFRSGRAYSMVDGTHRNGLGSMYFSMNYAGTPGNQELNIDSAAAWFPFAEGWIGGYLRGQVGPNNDAVFIPGPDGRVAATPGLPTTVASWNTSQDGTAQVRITLPGIDSGADGVLLAGPTDGNNNPNYIVASPIEGGWAITARRTALDNAIEILPNNLTRFVFVYIPYSAANAVAGLVDGQTGATIHGTGGFTVTRLGVGRYEVRIPGKTDLDGSLMIQSAGFEPGNPGQGRRAFFSYEPTSGGAFEVQARALTEGNPGNVFGEDTELVDGDFALVWVDHTAPLSLCNADFNRDGFVDFFDLDAYLSCFEGVECPLARTADFNLDGFVDFFDVDEYIAAFEAGC